MEKDRLVAFSDGVIAVIITIMVLEMKVPRGTSLAALAGVAPVFLSYALSFVYVAIYWNNHHHFFNLVHRVDGVMLWANMHLLFWLSLVPFATGWMGENHFAPLPTALYGVALLMPALAWYGLQSAIIRRQGAGSALARTLGRDLKGKISPPLYALGIASAFFRHPRGGWDLCRGGAAVADPRPPRRTRRAPQLTPRAYPGSGPKAGGGMRRREAAS